MSNEREELPNQKTELREKLRSLDEKQLNLDGRVKVLEEKIAIEELENGKATRETISLLESKIDGLEQRVREISQGTDAHEPKQLLTPATSTNAQAKQVTSAASEVTSDNSEDEGFIVVNPVEPTLIGNLTIGDSEKVQEKKKRKLF